ncbi:MAG: ester cyclase [Stellaceae bacterium]
MNPVRQMLAGTALSLLSAVTVAQPAAADQIVANAALLKTYFAAVNDRNLAALKNVISNNYLQHGAYQGQGLAGMQAAFRHDFEMFLDFHWTVEDSVITNNKIVARFRIAATHDHPVQLAPGAPVFPPTGKKISSEGISIWRVADGKFIEHWDVDDLLGAVQRMRPRPATPAKQP